MTNNLSKVKNALKMQRVETPIGNYDLLSDHEKMHEIEGHIFKIMKILNLDLNDDSLKDTPKRVSKMFVEEIFSGLDYSNFPKITTIENKMGVDCMVIEKDITLHSTCEHHLVTIAGHCHIGYIPKNKVIGLSKMNRIVDFFSKRPQVQERLCQQIMVAMQTLLETENVIVMIKAKHYCVAARGIRDSASETITTSLCGVFSEHEARSEFMRSINV